MLLLGYHLSLRKKARAMISVPPDVPQEVVRSFHFKQGLRLGELLGPHFLSSQVGFLKLKCD